MPITVAPVYQIFRIEIKHEEEKVAFDFKQLDYRTKSKISRACNTVEQGQFKVDAYLQVFLNLKHGLKNVDGIVDEEGNKFTLQFEDALKTMLTDECVDQLLASVVSDGIQFSARCLTHATVPKEIVHPLTGEKMEGIEVISPKELGSLLKK